MRRVDLAADGTAAGDTTPTGFPSIDKWLGGGVRAGDLVVVGGDVGSGKSALALAMAMRVAEAGRQARFLTTEMTMDRVMERAVAIEGRARVDDLRTGSLDEIARASVGAAALRIRDAKPIVEVAPQTAEGVANRLHSMMRDEKFDVAFVDSLQGLVGVTNLPLEEEHANVVRVLKQAALDLNVSIVLLAQLSMRPKKRRETSDERPTLADFGAKDAVRHHADVVTAIFREEMYHPGGGAEGGTEFLFLKNRNGTTGYIDLYFYKQWLRFEDMLDPDR